MPGYNNYNSYGAQSQIVNPRINTIPVNNSWGNNGYMNYIQPQQSNSLKTYVNGRPGADAFQLPPGVNSMILWDADSQRFFVKGYDNNGMPRVLEDNDYTPHTEPEPVQQPQVDLNGYATKEDIKQMIAEAFSNATIPSMAGYVTRKEMDKAFESLSLGNGGRIVRNNESNG